VKDMIDAFDTEVNAFVTNLPQNAIRYVFSKKQYNVGTTTQRIGSASSVLETVSHNASTNNA
jgi:hypothetical protein